MSEEFSFIFDKKESGDYIDFEKKKFYTKVNKSGNKKYSTFVSDKINEKYKSSLRVSDGHHFGKRLVSIYFQCAHGIKFIAKTSAKNIKPDKDIKFDIIRNSVKNCECGRCFVV